MKTMWFRSAITARRDARALRQLEAAVPNPRSVRRAPAVGTGSGLARLLVRLLIILPAIVVSFWVLAHSEPATTPQTPGTPTPRVWSLWN